MRQILGFALAFVIGATASVTASAKDKDVAVNDPENTLVMELESGQVLIELAPDSAPNHVARIKELTREGFYDGIVFHRVIAGFMAQTGDPTGTGTSGSGQKLKAEFTNADFVRGALGMARAGHPDSADSQFFICFDEASHLNGQYTYLGKVIDGMDLIDSLKKGAPGSGAVADPDKMVSLKVYADTQ